MKMSKIRDYDQCYTNYLKLFNELKDTMGSYRWLNISQYGCEWGEGRDAGKIKCGCTYKEILRILGNYENRTRTTEQCKPNGLQIRYRPEIRKIMPIGAGDKKHTIVRLYRDIVLTKTTQSPSMTVVDLLSQIGGFLGLLVGASVITLFEVLELMTAGFCRRIDSFVTNRKVIPSD